MKKLEVDFNNSIVMVPTLVLEGLHFNVLLEMSWLKATRAITDVMNGIIIN